MKVSRGLGECSHFPPAFQTQSLPENRLDRQRLLPPAAQKFQRCTGWVSDGVRLPLRVKVKVLIGHVFVDLGRREYTASFSDVQDSAAKLLFFKHSLRRSVEAK